MNHNELLALADALAGAVADARNNAELAIEHGRQYRHRTAPRGRIEAMQDRKAAALAIDAAVVRVIHHAHRLRAAAAIHNDDADATIEAIRRGAREARTRNRKADAQ